MRDKNQIAQRGSTIFLRLALIGMAVIVLGLCALILPNLHEGWTIEYPQLSYARYPIVVGFGLTTIPFFIALSQAFKLLSFIDKNIVFSKHSARALNTVALCACSISAIYLIGLPLMYQVAQIEDAPGLILMWTALSCAPLAIAVFAAVARRLLENVIALKSENDLTV